MNVIKKAKSIMIGLLCNIGLIEMVQSVDSAGNEQHRKTFT